MSLYTARLHVTDFGFFSKSKRLLNTKQAILPITADKFSALLSNDAFRVQLPECFANLLPNLVGAHKYAKNSGNGNR